MNLSEQIFLILVVAGSVVFTTSSVERTLGTWRSWSILGSLSADSAGQPREVNRQRLQTLQEQGKLSAHEARYYHQIQAATP